MKKTVILATLAMTSFTHAYEGKITKGQLPATLEAMIEKAKSDTQVDFSVKDFDLVEERNLATSKYLMYVQKSSFIPVANTAIRIWSNLKTNELILAEMHLNETAKKNEGQLEEKFKRAKFSPGALKSKQLSRAITEIVTEEVSKHDTDARILGMKFKDLWVDGDLVREVEVRGRRGVHHISISLLKNKVVQNSYIEFPQSENFYTFKANIFPIYEEVELTGEKLPFEVKELKYVSTQIPDGGETPLGPLSGVSYPESKYNPILAETPMGQILGAWSEASIRREVEALVTKMPLKVNDFASGLLLQGKYATINLHPGVKGFKDVQFPLKPSPHHMISWGAKDGEFVASPVSTYYGKTVSSAEEIMSRIPVRLPDHNPVSYINAGFDEVQVYYGVTTLMDALNEMGFEDPELSTKPFHAFLYDPDIGMRDNAYYYDNSINFTTYSPEMINLARDNSTIWHELGHGVMERLMGPHLSFADSKGGYGGLSEGMADFVAKIVVEHQTEGATFAGKGNFRIINKTGFYLTNEFHDEGEAYGGVMNDMLEEAIKVQGREGLYDFTDLTLETMRLTRNHPALTPKSWFEHMLYADELGSEVREAGQFKGIIMNALTLRNFSFSKDFKAASMKLTFNNTELTSISEASRERPLTPCSSTGFVSYDLKLALNSGDAQFLKFPLTVKVEFKKGALQGAIKWEGEDKNPISYDVQNETDMLTIPVKASMECDFINQPDGSCKDYAYIQIFNQGDVKPRAKKRFYLKIKDKAECKSP